MDEVLARHIEAALGLESGSVRRTGRNLQPSDRVRYKVWAKGLCTRSEPGVFVYNHWLDRKGPGLYKSKLATVKLTRTGWEASVRGITTHGSTAQEAAAKLSSGVHTVITIANMYRELRLPGRELDFRGALPDPLGWPRRVFTRGATLPTKRSGGRGSRRSSSRGQGRKG